MTKDKLTGTILPKAAGPTDAARPSVIRNLLGDGADLWDNDEDFDKFLLSIKRDSPEMISFWTAMKEKFNQKTAEGRSAEPWKDHNYGFLVDRLYEEIAELKKYFDRGIVWKNEKKEVQGELIDVANFCMFLWLKLEDNNE